MVLAPEGRRLLDRMDAARRASAEIVFGRLDAADRDILLGLLRELLADPLDACGHPAAGHRVNAAIPPEDAR